MASSKFDSFTITKTHYKTVSDHGIEAYILIPKGTKPGTHPVIVRFHGGCLIVGHALYPDWFPQYFIDYALQHNAIIVAANYRLLPEVSGLDILSDIADFWTWLHRDFAPLVQTTDPAVQADLSRILVAGESAGGYLSIQSALTQPARGIRAVFATYPMLDIASEYYTKAFPKTILGAPQIPDEVLDGYLATMKKGDVLTETPIESRIPLAVSAVQRGRFAELLGSDASLYPLDVVSSGKVAALPVLVIAHGTEDSMVPIEGSDKFAELVRGRSGTDAVILYRRPGEHGFDQEESLETPWLRDALQKVTAAWLE